jgi:chemotaxis protein MotB
MRLWLYAIAMTVAATAAGYFGWQRDTEAQRLGAAYEACSIDLEPIAERLREADQRAEACEDDILGIEAQAQASGAKLAKIEGNLSATREELEALRAQRAEAEKQLESVAKLQAQFAKMVDTGQLAVTARRGSFVVEMPAEVLFRSGSADLSEQGQLSVLEVGFILKQFPDRRFVVVGHTDSVPLKNAKFRDNWELSTARALTVTHVLVKAGMKPGALLAAGAGEHDPVRNNARPADRQRNRRIEIQLLPAVAELPLRPAAPKAAAPKAAA